MDILSSERPAVFVSLARNEPELAEAAAAAGADGLKVHLNVFHRASENEFGDVEAERAAIEAIADTGLPVGVVPGQDLATVERTLPRLADLPVSFVDTYAHHLPATVASLTELPFWVAPSEGYELTEIVRLPVTGADLVELSVVPKERYGERISARDIATYDWLASEIDAPVMLPSQLEITPADGRTMIEHGITNFLLGVVVTGDEPDGVEQTVGEFIDALPGRD